MSHPLPQSTFTSRRTEKDKINADLLTFIKA